jgi:hypothetical protein
MSDPKVTLTITSGSVSLKYDVDPEVKGDVIQKISESAEVNSVCKNGIYIISKIVFDITKIPCCLTPLCQSMVIEVEKYLPYDSGKYFMRNFELFLAHRNIILYLNENVPSSLVFNYSKIVVSGKSDGFFKALESNYGNGYSTHFKFPNNGHVRYMLEYLNLIQIYEGSLLDQEYFRYNTNIFTVITSDVNLELLPCHVTKLILSTKLDLKSQMINLKRCRKLKEIEAPFLVSDKLLESLYKLSSFGIEKMILKDSNLSQLASFGNLQMVIVNFDKVIHGFDIATLQ